MSEPQPASSAAAAGAFSHLLADDRRVTRRARSVADRLFWGQS